MTTSCLDRTLISKSVAGTGANVTLLLQALTPLCPKPTPPVQMYADHIVTIAIGYVCGFLPWGFLALFDFISAKWKTVRSTRRLGYFHLGASVIPMVFVIAYAVLQALSGDYKEMMTALIAVLLILHHVLRTLWGLVQLREYVTWCRGTMECIRATKPRYWYNMWQSSDKDDDYDESINLDEALMVNEDIVDNEFSGRDVSVSYSFSNRTMLVSNPEVCTIRWAAAFLCSLGHTWKSPRCKPLPDPLSLYMADSLFHTDESLGDSPPVSFMYLSGTLFSKGSNCGSFGSKISANLLCGWNGLKSFQFELDSIVSSYPPCNESEEQVGVEQNRIDARLELVEFILAARMLGAQKLRAIAAQSNHRQAKFFCCQQLKDAFDVLQHQLGIEEHVRVSDVHYFWRLAMVPCFSPKPNAFTLQTSVEVDICTAISLGDFLAENENVRTMMEEHVGHFDNSNSPLQSLSLSEDCEYFLLGTSLDVVRTFLAEWVLMSGTSIDGNCWHPILRKDPVCFSLSDYLIGELTDGPSHFYDTDCALAECQIAMEQSILRRNLTTSELPRSTEMIALLLLSHPALKIDLQEFPQEIVGQSSPNFEFSIRPMIAPQNVSLSLRLDTRSGAASVKIVPENDEMKFDWEKWINAAMQLMESYNKIARTEIEKRGKSKFQGPLDLIKTVDLSRPMCELNQDPKDEALSQLPGKLNVWAAWPIFDVGFCQFELGQWMDACGSLPDCWYEADDEYRRRKANAMETLTKIAGWDRT